MRIIAHKFVFCIVLFMLWACNERRTFDSRLRELEQGPSVALSNPEIIIDSLLAPSDILVCDSVIVISDRHSVNMIQLFDFDGNFLDGCLKRGKGPGETVNLLDVSPAADSKICATVADEKVYVYDIHAIVRGGKLPESIYALPQGNYAFSSIVMCDSLLFYVGKDISKNEENSTLYCTYDVEEEQLSAFGALPPTDIYAEDYPVDDFTIQTIYQGEPLYHHETGKVVIPFFYAVGFEIIAPQSGKVETSAYYTMPDVEVSHVSEYGFNAVKRKESAYVGFLDAACTSTHVYFLYSGKTFGESGYNQGKYILKFDWSGKLQMRYELDREISAFCLGQTSDEIFCIHESEIGAQVLRY